jgi:hypothetical protein
MLLMITLEHPHHALTEVDNTMGKFLQPKLRSRHQAHGALNKELSIELGEF